MIIAYYFLTWVAFFLGAIPLFFLSFFKAKYKKSLKARFFLYKNSCQKAQVHFHACSLGEVKSIGILSEKFDSRISVITQTGFECAKNFCKKVNFLAFENWLPFWFKPCEVLVIFEAEYWLILVFMAKLRGARVLLINARISNHSYETYLRFAFFYRLIFSYIDEVFAQSAKDKQRLEQLGAKNVKIFKNIKANLEIKPSKHYTKLKERLIVFASTHQKEEELLLKFVTLQENEKLIIAPRHPERFLEVENLLQHHAYEKFSNLKKWEDFKGQILLLDVLGELINFYAISDVVVLGGSFVEGIGGHNPIEVASFNNILITGIFIHNQENLFAEVENVNFCEDLTRLDFMIHHLSKKARISQNKDLSVIENAIKEGLNARKSL
ncbi:lipid IV(A) 3-deoxy-D-manno-octulosonic acid transferase [Campylobacter vulpis]|uniref:3-deoxy-D-manno-octulosonic acid transferase n=1 Tax=Campylobacter vulpis TaxID=1655500 RepID=A0A2G4QZD5_9BACT|nr:lipid IV(A) 3-deoxy-D-manno-octulosonic acid transferase [Campylobacter vulpis]MBS4240546.1 3-deoxy-D-manno-octulosonic acid transferase [Campylobacter vulpis]MBS4251961.1 3-deoxy-D-manno-octulosonic acid transferase [Campylobacter vulpis]MBS4281136.1 3-deoxy-D-manno-octulosonic acid transferase [Campylobacter vulpis]MBS4329367.1 3-deoxy-D-manno-octulosonic acid transferase [Campylobacter vulpis]MBS4330661.1 3-deoxy-D-manno-octulosonic acid transferase [Campylobacter vulpis]